MTAFSDRLKEERKRLGLSQADLAEATGVSLNSQSNYENGHRSPDAVYLERVASMGVDVTFLLSGLRGFDINETEGSAEVPPSAGPGRTVMKAVTPAEAEFLDDYRAADERGRAAARIVLDALAQVKRADA